MRYPKLSTDQTATMQCCSFELKLEITESWCEKLLQNHIKLKVHIKQNWMWNRFFQAPIGKNTALPSFCVFKYKQNLFFYFPFNYFLAVEPFLVQWSKQLRQLTNSGFFFVGLLNLTKKNHNNFKYTLLVPCNNNSHYFININIILILIYR